MTTARSPRVLLVRAPVSAPRLLFPDNPWVGIPIGLLYLESALQNAGGIEVKILDAMAHPDFKKIRRPDSDGRFGPSDVDFQNQVAEFRPDLVCFTVVAGRYLPDTVKAARLVREVLPKAFVIAGGHDVTSRPQEYLYSDAFPQGIVVGEGEETLVQLVRTLQSGGDWKSVAGMAYLNDDGEIKKNPTRAIENLDQYRLNFDSIQMEQYFELYRQGFGGRKNISLRGNHRTVFITTSRGCPYPCGFCSIYQTMGRRMRYHSVEYVLELIERLVKRYGVQHIHFEDDHLTANREHFKEILRGIIRLDLKITWDTPNGVRADSFDQEMLNLCRASGCVYLMFGVESGSQEVLDKIIHKHLDLKQLEHTLEMCRKTGIDTMALFMIGLPGETKAQMRQTYRYAFYLLRKYHTMPFMGLFKPFYETPLYKVSKEKKFLVDFDKESKRQDIPDMLFTPLMIETKDFDISFLSALYRRYMMGLACYGTLSWIRITLQKPWIFAKLVAQLAWMTWQTPRQLKKVGYDFFWGAMIYPKTVLRMGNRMHWWLYESFE